MGEDPKKEVEVGRDREARVERPEVVEQRAVMEHRLMGQVVAAAAEFAGRPGTGQKIDLLPLGGYQAT